MPRRIVSLTRRKMLAAHPGMLDSRGPHGIPLDVHAAIGGEPARAVAEHLAAPPRPPS